MNPIQQAIDAVGGRTSAASLLGISYVAVRKMVKKGVLPRTDYTGETHYAKILANHSNGKVTQEWLLDRANPKTFSSRKKHYEP